jgi:hypothetical protein
LRAPSWRRTRRAVALPRGRAAVKRLGMQETGSAPAWPRAARCGVSARMAEQGQTPLGSTPAESDAAIKAQAPRWEALIRVTGVKAQ